MKKLILLACTTLLVACGGTPEGLNLSVEINASTPEKATELLKASKRVVERRLKSLGVAEPKVQLVDGKSMVNAQLDDLENKEAVETFLIQDLTQPFSISFMHQSSEEEADVTVGEAGSFKKTDLNETHVTWVNVNTVGNLALGVMNFSPEGLELKKKIFAEHLDEDIGVFVRSVPVYKLKVEQDDIDSPTLNIKIPDVNIAHVFADDVNVALHVTYTPVE